MKFIFKLECNRKFSGGFRNEYHNITKFHETYFKDVLSSLWFLEGPEKGAFSFQGAVIAVNIMIRISFLKL